MDKRGVPMEVASFDSQLSVLVDLVPDNEHIQVKLTKLHDNPEIPQVQLEVDPRSMLLRWR